MSGRQEQRPQSPGERSRRAASRSRRECEKKGCRPDANTPYNRSLFRRAFQRSSVVERATVNRLVVGSNPTAGANYPSRFLTDAAGNFFCKSWLIMGSWWIECPSAEKREMRQAGAPDARSGKGRRKNFRTFSLTASRSSLQCTSRSDCGAALEAVWFFQLWDFRLPLNLVPTMK